MNAALFYKLMAIREKRLPLWLECSTGTVSIGMYDNPKRADVQYSLDGGTWQDIADTQIPLTAGQRAYFRQKPLLNSTVYTGPAPGQKWDYTNLRNPDRNRFMNFTMSGEGTVKAGGNIHSMYDYKNGEQMMSQYQLANLFYSCTQLVQAPELPDKALTASCYMHMFYGCTSLTAAPALPAMTLTTYCYRYMFHGCTSLTAAPALPATTLSAYGYGSMFEECTSLTAAPALPAMTLVTSCYRHMFHGCTSLTTAPALPAMTMTTSCYYGMFYGCTSLTIAPALPATTLATSCYHHMFHGCTSLTTAPALPATELANNCYANMFHGCTSLTTAPALPAMTMTTSCYYGMFYGCTHLTAAPALPATELADNCYSYMFYGCTSLTVAPELPATKLFYGCYSVMFHGCTSLTAAPALPATTLAAQCYNHMFSGCTSLTVAPELPATTLANNCYYNMFQGCINLVQPPALPSTQLAEFCYGSMFQDCIKLKAPPALPAMVAKSRCYAYMFWGCKALESMPELPATTLETSCYTYMFRDCPSITGSIPALPATELADKCYACMFYGCKGITGHVDLPAAELKKDCYNYMFLGTSITSMSVAFTDWHDAEGDEINGADLGDGGATMYMLNGVPAGGTFTKPAALPDKRGHRYVPGSWTVKSIIPTDGLVFYMPMKDTITKAIVNGAEVKSAEYFANASDVSFTTDSTIPCTCFNGNTWLCHLPVTATEYTMTLWFKPQVKTLTDGTTTSHYAVYTSGWDYAIVNTTGSTTIRWAGSTGSASTDIKWHFLAFKYSSQASYVRLDDVTGPKGTGNVTLNNNLSIAGGGDVNIMYGQLQTNGNEFKGYMAGLRIFNRLLSDEEIEALRHEFTPTE